MVYAWTRDKPGRLSKGKIHCLCRMKSYDYKSHSDRKKEDAYTQQLYDVLLHEYQTAD